MFLDYNHKKKYAASIQDFSCSFDSRGREDDNCTHVYKSLPTAKLFHRNGDVAQLGERGVRNAEAEGSIPFISTIFLFLAYIQKRVVFSDDPLVVSFSL